MAEAPQPPPAEPKPTTLEDLPMDVKLSILRFIPCEVDRVHLSHVCRAWRKVISGGVEAEAKLPSPPPRPLPWLLLPVPDPYASVSDAVCVLSGCRVHRQLTITPPGARCFGSHDGGWLFLHYGLTRLHALLNVRTGRAHVLPSFVAPHNEVWPLHTMFILAAALSSSPDDASCTAIFIGASCREPYPSCLGDGGLYIRRPHHPRRCAAYWRQGWGWACEIAPHLRAEDVTYHGGSFYLLLSHGNDIYVCTPVQGGSMIKQEERRVCPGAHQHQHHQRFRACYLVVSSRNELLLVKRYVLPAAPHRPMTTSEFRVFRATTRREEVPDAYADFPVAHYPWAWIELDTLGDRMLFVGHGCSRGYEANQYPGFKGGIYFLDDGKFYEEAVLIRDRPSRPYKCYDNGNWSEGRVYRCFPTPPTSYRSAPAWLLP
ncbi:hypothetical protein BS78_05G120800 [Paspalum vaginatum]|nr:hypothetical protein BS78_05G120800 [Paspalum vaginatum]